MTIEASILRSAIFRPMLLAFCNVIQESQPSPSHKTHVLFSGILSECPYILKAIEEFISSNGFNEKFDILKPVDG